MPQSTPLQYDDSAALISSIPVDTDDDINVDNVNEVAIRVRALSISLDRGTCRLVLLLPAFDRHKGWARDGYKSCIGWLNSECSMSSSAAYERLRVAYALEHLPIITELFKSGKLSWSKVRALTRIATAENEQVLAGEALHQSASEIEQTVRQFRDVSSAEELAEETAEAAEQYDKRSVSYGYDHNGMLKVQALLPPLEGTAFVRSLQRAEDVLFTSAEATGVDDDARRTARQLRADALELMAARYIAAEDLDGRTADQYQVVVHVDASVFDKPNYSGRCHIQNGPAIAASSVRRLLDQASVLPLVMKDGEPLSIGRKSRVWTAPISRAIVARDGHCQYPGCTAHRHLQIHHMQHWGDGGETSVENGVTLCGFHHRLVHERQYTIERTPLDAHGMLPTRTTTISTGGVEFTQLVSTERRFRVRRPDGAYFSSRR